MSVTDSASASGDTVASAAVKNCEGGACLARCCAWFVLGFI